MRWLGLSEKTLLSRKRPLTFHNVSIVSSFSQQFQAILHMLTLLNM